MGAWKEITHPKAKPVEIWKKACLNGSYPVLKLHISSLSMQLASYIPYLGFNLFVNLDEDSDSEQKKESVSKSDNEDSESKKSSGNESDNDGSASESESEVKMKIRVIERYHMPVVTSAPNSLHSYINWVFILNLWID